MPKKNVSYNYTVEVVSRSFCNAKRPRWEDMISIASNFTKRKDALDFVHGDPINHVGARFFVVTFRDDKVEPVRITEVPL